MDLLKHSVLTKYPGHSAEFPLVRLTCNISLQWTQLFIKWQFLSVTGKRLSTLGLLVQTCDRTSVRRRRSKRHRLLRGLPLLHRIGPDDVRGTSTLRRGRRQRRRLHRSAGKFSSPIVGGFGRVGRTNRTVKNPYRQINRNTKNCDLKTDRC